MPDVTQLRTDEHKDFSSDLDEIAREGARRMLADAHRVEVAGRRSPGACLRRAGCWRAHRSELDARVRDGADRDRLSPRRTRHPTPARTAPAAPGLRPGAAFVVAHPSDGKRRDALHGKLPALRRSPPGDDAENAGPRSEPVKTLAGNRFPLSGCRIVRLTA